jgi:urease accessory protein
MSGMTELLRVLQFADSTLPVGSFSFSNGLESAVQHGIVHDRRSLKEFVRTAARQAATVDGVALLAAHRAALLSNLERVVSADWSLIQRKLNEEMRLMTVRMGRKLGELASGMIADPLVKKWLSQVKRGETPGTYPIGLALVFAAIAASEEHAFAVHQYGVAAMMLAAALRLMRISFAETQAILLEVNSSTEAFYELVSRRGLDDMAGFAPLADIVAASHSKAHVRMFMN